MAVIRVNMDKRSKGGAPTPDGDYVCEVISIVEGESSQKKSPQLNVQFEVHEGAHAGGKLIDFIPMTDNSAFRSADLFWACGVDEPGESDIDTDSFSRLNADGEEVQEQGILIMIKKVTQDETDKVSGETRKRIRLFYSRYNGEGGVPAAEGEAEEAAPEAKPAAAPAGAPKPAIGKKPVGRPPGPGKVKIKA
jgi:hypothetical protein